MSNVAVQPCLCQAWSLTLKTGFLMTRLTLMDLLSDYHFHLLMSRAVLHWQSAIQWLQKRQAESKYYLPILTWYIICPCNSCGLSIHSIKVIFKFRSARWYFSSGLSFNRKLFLPAAKILISHHILQHLIWACTFCLFLKIGMPDYSGLSPQNLRLICKL